MGCSLLLPFIPFCKLNWLYCTSLLNKQLVSFQICFVLINILNKQIIYACSLTNKDHVVCNRLTREFIAIATFIWLDNCFSEFISDLEPSWEDETFYYHVITSDFHTLRDSGLSLTYRTTSSSQHAFGNVIHYSTYCMYFCVSFLEIQLIWNKLSARVSHFPCTTWHLCKKTCNSNAYFYTMLTMFNTNWHGVNIVLYYINYLRTVHNLKQRLKLRKALFQCLHINASEKISWVCTWYNRMMASNDVVRNGLSKFPISPPRLLSLCTRSHIQSPAVTGSQRLLYTVQWDSHSEPEQCPTVLILEILYYLIAITGRA
jgi:hypothetical protein